MVQEEIADPAENALGALLTNDLMKTMQNVVATVEHLRGENVQSVLRAIELLRGKNNSMGMSDESLTAEDLRERFDAVARVEPPSLEVLALVAQGYNNKAIEKKLFISYTTLKRRFREIYQELNIARTSLPENSEFESRVRAVLYYQAYTRYIYAVDKILQSLNVSNGNSSENT